MPNSLELAKKFQQIMDEVYKLGSLTADLDGLTKPINNAGANEVLIYKTTVVGLGDYSKSTGYPAGDVTGAWETIKLEKDRGRSFSIDAVDDEEMLGMAMGQTGGEFMRTQVVPEIDAYRFQKWVQASGVSTVTAATLDTSANVLAAIDAAMLQMDEDEVPSEGRRLYISATCYSLLKGAVTRQLANDANVSRILQSLDGVSIKPVPQKRFYTKITLNTGSASNAGGFTKAADGLDLNFILMHPSARDQAVKHNVSRVFSPEVNQTADAWLLQYRVYHDTWVYDNKVDGIYYHSKAS